MNNDNNLHNEQSPLLPIHILSSKPGSILNPQNSEAQSTGTQIQWNKLLGYCSYIPLAIASLGNGYIYYAPAQNGLKNVFHYDAQSWALKNFLGTSAFVANALLSFETIKSLMSLSNISGSTNIAHKLLFNFFMIVFKLLGVALSLLVVLPVSVESLSADTDYLQYAKTGFSSLVAAGVYTEGWLNILRAVYPYLKNSLSISGSSKPSLSTIKNELNYLYTYSNTAYFKKSFILAHNETLLEPYIIQLRLSLLELTHALTGNEQFNTQQVYSTTKYAQLILSEAFKSNNQQQIKNIRKLLTNAYNFDGDYLKNYIIEHPIYKGPRSSTNQRVKLITLYYENQKRGLNKIFLDALIKNHIKFLCVQLQEDAPYLKDKIPAHFYCPEYHSGNRILAASDTYKNCLTVFANLPAVDQCRLVYKLHESQKNYFLIRSFIALPIQMVFVASVILSALSIAPTSYYAGENIANRIWPNQERFALSLAISCSFMATAGRLGLYIKSGLSAANKSVNFLWYLSKLQINLMSLGYLLANTLLYLPAIILILPSPLGYTSVCIQGLEKFLPQSWLGWLLPLLASFSYIGAYLVNVSSALNFSQKIIQLLATILPNFMTKTFQDHTQLYKELLSAMDISPIQAPNLEMQNTEAVLLTNPVERGSRISSYNSLSSLSSYSSLSSLSSGSIQKATRSPTASDSNSILRSSIEREMDDAYFLPPPDDDNSIESDVGNTIPMQNLNNNSHLSFLNHDSMSSRSKNSLFYSPESREEPNINGKEELIVGFTENASQTNSHDDEEPILGNQALGKNYLSIKRF